MQILFQKCTFREIEIRKVNGARVFEILSMLIRDFAKLESYYEETGRSFEV